MAKGIAANNRMGEDQNLVACEMFEQSPSYSSHRPGSQSATR